jgi:hypothetical protein
MEFFVDIENVFIKSYLMEFAEIEKKKILLSRKNEEIALAKKEKLIEIEKFLKKFIDFGVVVFNKNKFFHNDGIKEEDFDLENKKFIFYYMDSSKTWSPGISLCFDNPAAVEIAVPNNREDGYVVVKVSSDHPDAYILEQKFLNPISVCDALGKFLSKNTVSLNVDSLHGLVEKHRKTGGNEKNISTNRVGNAENSVNIVKIDDLVSSVQVIDVGLSVVDSVVDPGGIEKNEVGNGKNLHKASLKPLKKKQHTDLSSNDLPASQQTKSDNDGNTDDEQRVLQRRGSSLKKITEMLVTTKKPLNDNHLQDNNGNNSESNE